MPRYFEDLTVGEVCDLGSVTVSAEEIVDFAECWDPLPQHVDPVAAEDSITDGLVASGLHTVALSNRLATREFRFDLAGIVGLGFSDLHFSAPVRPGDEVHFRLEIVDARPSRSDPTVGIMTTRITGETAEGTAVLEYAVTTLVRRRPATDGTADLHGDE